MKRRKNKRRRKRREEKRREEKRREEKIKEEDFCRRNCFMSYVLGIDGGGSKTVCVLMDGERRVLGRGYGGASNYQSVGVNSARDAIESAIFMAVSGGLKFTGKITISAICLGLAGVGRPHDFEVVKSIVKYLESRDLLPISWELQENNIVICNDALIALVGGVGDDVGIVVAAGTGSIVFGRNHQGVTKRVGGWGYILGDEGGAYKIAVAGMQAAMKSYDGREISTRLIEDFKQYLCLESIENLLEIVYRHGWGVKEIAALAPIVDNAAASGDEVANNIISDAVQDLVDATFTVVKAIFNTTDSFKIVTAGSVWLGKSKIRERFTQAILKNLSSVKIILPKFEPAYGAALLALKNLS
jgi:N-acetylglucosamine kinase-like BadF-type ATPase